MIAPHVPAFKDAHPQIDLRLRLSDRKVDVTAEGLDCHKALTLYGSNATAREGTGALLREC